MQQLRHVASNSINSFTRLFDYGNGATNYLQSVHIGANQVAYKYDAVGNVVQEDSSRHYQWDAANQLQQFATWTGTGSSPTLLAYYLYAGSQRVKKLTQTSADTWQVTVYGDGAFEHRYEVTQGSLTGEQTQVTALDGPHRLYQRRTGDALGDQRPGKLYILDDHLGSAVAQTTTAGQLVSREEYYPFGETSFGSTAKQRYRFCSKELDKESGLYYYGARYYVAWLCRFVSVDPLAAKYAFYTPYQYAGNKPIGFIDLDGLEPSILPNNPNWNPIKLRDKPSTPDVAYWLSEGYIIASYLNNKSQLEYKYFDYKVGRYVKFHNEQEAQTDRAQNMIKFATAGSKVTAYGMSGAMFLAVGGGVLLTSEGIETLWASRHFQAAYAGAKDLYNQYTINDKDLTKVDFSSTALTVAAAYMPAGVPSEITFSMKNYADNLFDVNVVKDKAGGSRVVISTVFSTNTNDTSSFVKYPLLINLC